MPNTIFQFLLIDHEYNIRPFHAKIAVELPSKGSIMVSAFIPALANIITKALPQGLKLKDAAEIYFYGVDLEKKLHLLLKTDKVNHDGQFFQAPVENTEVPGGVLGIETDTVFEQLPRELVEEFIAWADQPTIESLRNASSAAAAQAARRYSLALGSFGGLVAEFSTI